MSEFQKISVLLDRIQKRMDLIADSLTLFNKGYKYNSPEMNKIVSQLEELNNPVT